MTNEQAKAKMRELAEATANLFPEDFQTAKGELFRDKIAGIRIQWENELPTAYNNTKMVLKHFTAKMDRMAATAARHEAKGWKSISRV